MPAFLRTVLLSLPLLLLAACGTIQVGHDFDMNTFQSQVEQGTTTRNQVRDWLGNPSGTGVSVSADGQRYDEWTYYFGEGKASAMSAAKMKILQIKFDRQGIVRSYNWSTSGR